MEIDEILEWIENASDNELRKLSIQIELIEMQKERQPKPEVDDGLRGISANPKRWARVFGLDKNA